MPELVERHPAVARTQHKAVSPSRAAYHAFQLLHAAFVVAPTIAGADKFLGWLADWDRYVAPQIGRALPFGMHSFMLFIGLLELGAALWVALQPRIGAYLVAAGLCVSILNLAIQGSYWDIVLRDLTLLLGAVALGRLANAYHRGGLVEHPASE